ncbi:type IV pilin protein [Neisseria arctica]|nr:type IV pilin protein [Neisseria arctica]UOO85738.1 pilin [Neisseria arctica]
MLFNMNSRGFTIIQIIFVILIISIITMVVLPTYQQHTRKARIERARAALLENAHYLERFYSRHSTFKQTSTTWPNLPVTHTQHFCIRPQGNARGALDDKFMLKAVAYNKQDEPRIIKINESLTTYLCETSSSTCSDKNTFFTGGSRVDKNCKLYQ